MTTERTWSPNLDNLEAAIRCDPYHLWVWTAEYAGQREPKPGARCACGKVTWGQRQEPAADTDVTDQVEFGLNDDKILPITRCICGHEFQYWDFIICLGPTSAKQCPHCDRWLYFRIDIRIFEGKEPQ